MKISIITPCFNSEEYIEETIKSVIYQQGNFDIEYIIIDGKSSDNTINIIEKYKKIIENGFKKKCNNVTLEYISEKDSSMYEALAKGIKKVSGEITGYINSDDVYLPNAFKCIVDIFRNERVDWITGRNSIINSDGILVESFLPFRYKKEFIKNGIYGTKLPSIQQESTIWRSKLNKLINLEELKRYKLAGDAYIWKCFSESFNLDIVQAGIACFRMRENQLSASGKYINEFNEIYRNAKISGISIFIEKIFWKSPTKIKLYINKNIMLLKLRGKI